MSTNVLINQIAAIILDVHSKLYTKEEGFDKITESLKNQDGELRYKQLQSRSRLLTAPQSHLLEEELNQFLSQLNERGHELENVTYQSHVFTDEDGHVKEEYSALVLYKKFA